MSLSPRVRMLVAFALANAVVLSVGAALLYGRPATPPRIQGVFLPQARALPAFELLDQYDRKFVNQHLEGYWHLVAYGFTSCPDICPTLLSDLVAVADELPDDEPLRFVFYSVDHRRDTPQQLNRYLEFFSEDLIGLTHRDDNADAHLPFESGLGMVSELVAQEGSDNYQVNHGVTLFLLNPDGDLQAVFSPELSAAGNGIAQPGFAPETLVNDYLAVRRYVADNSP